MCQTCSCESVCDVSECLPEELQGSWKGSHPAGTALHVFSKRRVSMVNTASWLHVSWLQMSWLLVGCPSQQGYHKEPHKTKVAAARTSSWLAGLVLHNYGWHQLDICRRLNMFMNDEIRRGVAYKFSSTAAAPSSSPQICRYSSALS